MRAATDRQEDPKAECYLSVVIPAYNEAHRLPATLDRVYSYLCRKSWPFEIVVVDDGSSDATADIAERFFESHPGGIVLRNGENHGKGYSVRRGMLHAIGSYVLFSDADLSTPIEEVEKLLGLVSGGHCQVAIASRAVKDARISVRQPWYRVLMGKMFNRFVRAVVVSGISDTQCGFKCFTREAAAHLFREQRITGFGFDVEVLYIARESAYVIEEVPVVWVNSDQSKVRILQDSSRMMADLCRIRWNDLTQPYRRH